MAKSTLQNQNARAERRRRQILDAAAKCFVRNGFAKTTIADIAFAAGLSKPALYTYFDNKERIIAALENQLVNRWIQTTKLPLQVAPGKYCEVIANSFRASFDFFFAEPILREFFISQANLFVVSKGSVIGAAISKVRDRLAVYIEKAQEVGDIRSDIDPQTAAEFLRIVHVAILEYASVSSEPTSIAGRGLADLSIDLALRAVEAKRAVE